MTRSLASANAAGDLIDVAAGHLVRQFHQRVREADLAADVGVVGDLDQLGVLDIRVIDLLGCGGSDTALPPWRQQRRRPRPGGRTPGP